jgi:RNA polymerase sigma-70 factor (ECF subfamily)
MKSGFSRGDRQPARFDALLRPHVPTLYRMAYRYTGRREDAEDLVQDLLTKLYPRTADLERVDDLKPWLVRSLYHAFIDSVRKRQRTVETEPLEHDDLPGRSDDLHDDILRAEQREALNAAIARLSGEHRAVVMLHLVEGYTLPELEQMLDVQLGTLKSRLFRAKAQLRAALGTLEPSWAREPNEPGERVEGHELRSSSN